MSHFGDIKIAMKVWRFYPSMPQDIFTTVIYLLLHYVYSCQGWDKKQHGPLISLFFGYPCAQKALLDLLKHSLFVSTALSKPL